jgi:predicted N-formylglutamate amidohydrolase
MTLAPHTVPEEGRLPALLHHSDAPAVAIERPSAASPIMLIADHAGGAVPRSLNGLGLSKADLARHIAIDIGVLGVSQQLSASLDATLIHQRYSRLVIDCNRHPQHESAFAAVSDGVRVPGNERISFEDAARRIVEIFMPYHAAITSQLDRRVEAGRPVALVAMHSFTPRHTVLTAARPWPISVLFNRDRAIADRLVALLAAEGLHVGVNEPYTVDEVSDFAIPVHGEARGIPSVEIEIRQDQIATPEAQLRWAALLGPLLERAVFDVLGLTPARTD